MYNRDKIEEEKLGVGMSNADLGEWIVIILLSLFVWPVGAVLLFRKLTGRKKRNKGELGELINGVERQSNSFTRRGNWAERRYQRRMEEARDNYSPENQIKKMLSNAKTMTVLGGIAGAVFGFGGIATFLDHLSWGGMSYALKDLFVDGGICVVGLVFMYGGIFQTKKAKRFQKYLKAIGQQKKVPVSALSNAVGIPADKVMDDLDEMLELEIIPVGYLDRGIAVLYLTENGMETAAEDARKQAEEAEFAALKEIREVNAAISDPVMSGKIDRIEDVTKKILDYQKKNPGRDAELRSFLDYYLPTTLKILRTYAQLEAQGVDGENITSAKKRIEDMMDKVVDGFETQLDKLFHSETLDITSDVQVLEQMLQKDGLSGGDFELKL